MESIDTAMVLNRILTSGIVMSIEKNDKELPGLERLLSKHTSRSEVVLLNSRTAAVHAALAGLGKGHGENALCPELDEELRAFVTWLGITPDEAGEEETPGFDLVTVTPEHASERIAEAGRSTAAAVVLDLTPLGFGPAGAVVTDLRRVRDRAERLKIFGAFDLRTMWTQRESEPDLVPGVQFNYRLSPLVAGCVRMALMQALSADKASRTSGTGVNS
ncbi:hypothetical protein [Actinopolyspora mortivallis]|uniref:hypothetical protein n=1 Tax=Actinopolyspora mortivallis TaxID=33906 RepID=UPI00037640C8